MTDSLIKDMDIKSYSDQDVLVLARVAEQSEQYQDMIDILKPYFENKQANGTFTELSTEERNCLSVAYKNTIGLKRIAWRAAKKALAT